MKILIIEDEKITAKDLARTIKAIEPDIEIVQTIESVYDGIAYLKTNPELDLIFSDIQLGDGLSFEIFEASRNKIPIIFCTAYNTYALDAFKTFGIDYILKPFSKQQISDALEKYVQLKGKENKPETNLVEMMNLLRNQISPQKSASVLVHQGDKIIPLESNDVALFYIHNQYVFAYTFNQKKYLLNQKLEALEKLFAPTFYRANRQFLINRKAVKDAAHFFNRKLIVNLNLPFAEQIIIGKLKVTEFTKWLAQ